MAFLVRSKGTGSRKRPPVEFIHDENEPLFPYETLLYNGILFTYYKQDDKIFIKPPWCRNDRNDYRIERCVKDGEIIKIYHCKNDIENTINMIKERYLSYKKQIENLKMGLSLILSSHILVGDVCLYIYLLGNDRKY